MTGNSFSFIVSTQPIPKARPRLARNGRVFTPSTTLEYERRVMNACSSSKPSDWPMDRTYSVRCLFFRDSRRAVDLDNLVKSVMDGMNGVAFNDDHLVKELHAVLDVDRENPRAIVTVTVN